MSSPAESGDTVRALMQLRCRQEVLQRWLASRELPHGLLQSLGATLAEVEQQLRVLTDSALGCRVDSLSQPKQRPIDTQH